MSRFDLLPALYEQSYFLLSTNQGCESSGHSNIETSPRATFPEDAVHEDRLSHTSKRVFAQVLALEVALDQSIGRFTDSNRIGRS
jgi:hypothetical protein